jgi:hypothetical protein
MKYRISICFICDEEKDAKKIYGFLKANKDLMRTVRKGEPNEEKSIIILEKHYHDEDPTKPCEEIERIESD